jgi:hypothetical protein
MFVGLGRHATIAGVNALAEKCPGLHPGYRSLIAAIL